MNFINDLAKYRFIFFLSVISGLSFISVSSQLSQSYLKTYPFYYDEGRCSAPGDLFIDNNGLIYISFPNFIIISNGNKEQKIATDGTMKFSRGQNKILTFNQNFVGYIQSDSKGNLSLSSYNTQFPEFFSSLSNISDVQSTGDTIYIFAKPVLYRIIGSKYEIIDSSFNSGKFFPVGNSLLIFKSGMGIKRADDTNYIQLSDIQELYPDFVLEHPKGYLIYSGNYNKFQGLSKTLKSKFDWQPFFNEQVLSADFDGETYIFYTSDCKFQVSDHNGQKDSIFEQVSLHAPLDLRKIILKDGKLWNLQYSSLSYTDLPPGIFKSHTIPEVFTRAILRKNQMDYFGGNYGLFASGQEKPWNRIIPEAVVSIINAGENSIIHSSGGLSIHNDQGLFPIFKGDVIACNLDKHSNSLYFSIPGKILSLQLSQNNTSIPVVLLDGVNAGILSIVKDKLWFSDGYSTGFLTLQHSSEKPQYLSLLADKLIDIFTVGDSLFLMTKKNIYLLNNGVYIPISGSDEFNRRAEFCKLIQCSANSHWLILKNQSSGYIIYHTIDFQTYQHVHHSQLDRSYPPVITQIDNNLYRIVSGESVYNCFMSYEEIPKSQNIFINSIKSGNDTIFNGLALQPGTVYEFSSSGKKIKINLSTDDFSRNPVSFRYEVNNRKTYYSDWESSDEIELSNLKWGTNFVTFFSSNDTHFAHGNSSLILKITKPVYLRFWAIFIFFITLFILAFIAYKTFIFNSLSTQPIALTPVAKGDKKNDTLQSDTLTYQSKPVPYDKSKWEKFELTTVLFSDIQGFTKIAEQMNPEMLIDELDKFFFHFDSVCEKYNIEKIKTIGDAYMAAGGIPKQNNTNPIEVVLAALEMQLYMKQLRNSRTDIWDLRIGIHSGPVIGGIIGHKKRSYDIWGDTVNTASRMESSGEPGKVNISGTTYALIKDFFICSYRGRLPVKYKGNIDMYFVKGLRPELSINLGTLPNRVFYLKIQHLKLKELEKEIFTKLESDLNEKYCFHTIDYIRNLYNLISEISMSEGISIEDELIVKTAFLLLYTGLAYSYKDFHEKSVSIAEEILPSYKFNKKQIFAVCNLILYAKLKEKPKTITEFIIHDVITNYMGKSHFENLCMLLYQEQNEFLHKQDIDLWIQKQIMNLKVHQFFTRTANQLREISSEQQTIFLQNANWE
jgi:adenylate cyclase